MNKITAKIWLYIIAFGCLIWIYLVSMGMIHESPESWYALILLIFLCWLAIVPYRIYRRTKLIGGLLSSIGSWLMLIGFSRRILFRFYPELSDNLTLLLVLLVVTIGGALLISISIGLLITKNSGGLNELRKRTTRMQRIFGNVPQGDLRGFPPDTKRKVVLRIGLGALLGALLFLFLGFLSYFITGWFAYEVIPAVIILGVCALIQIACSIHYLKA